MERVLNLIKKAEVVALTQELVRIKSYLGIEGVETELAEYIANFLRIMVSVLKLSKFLIAVIM